MKNYKGLTENEVLSSREQHGENILTPPPTTPWYILFLEKFKDPIIVILLVAAVISFAVGIVEGSFIESIGIVVAIILATGVSFYMEFSAKKKFESLSKTSDTEAVKVIRDGKVCEISKTELVVGDIVILSTGDEIPADLELTEALDLKVDESTMTGESVAAGKRAKSEGEVWNESGFAPYLVLRSTKITEGSGVGKVVAVGDNTNIGRTTIAATEETENETPLNRQLDWLGGWINKFAFGIALMLLLFLNLTHSFAGQEVMEIITTEIRFFMIALALIICAVPEGLPLASTLSLAFSMKTMARENNLIKKMHACETIGCVNVIFSDKTGTLTQNKMTVVSSDIRGEENVIMNALINSSANLGETGDVIGNPTEGAMIKYYSSKGYDYKKYRMEAEIIDQKPFNSTDKYMSTTIKTEDGSFVLLKGAPEVVSRIIGDDSFLSTVSEQQARGRRAISLVSGPDMEHLTYDGTLFIEDPVRPDVPGAVKDCYRAGVDVVMMTGDNVKTAKEIANQAGFNRTLQGPGKHENWAIEAKDFDSVAFGGKDPETGNWKDVSVGYPNVIARCKPEDKLHILKEFQVLGKGTPQEHVVAMTGDGVNDSPSLNHADVGIAMGSGTSVAKEAGDIILLDDAFPSIVTGIKWGRSLYKNIQSFLTFQLIINVATCLTVLFGPMIGVDMPFTVTQMLWVNIVMDTLAALCLASEPADPNVLLDKPRKQTQFILTKPMLATIFGGGFVVFAVLSTIVYDIANNSSAWFGMDLTELFAVFMVINWWNLYNIRVFGKNRSIFHSLFSNKLFVIGSLVILAGTIGIIQLGGEVFSTHPLSVKEWVIILAVTSPIVILRETWWRVMVRK